MFLSSLFLVLANILLGASSLNIVRHEIERDRAITGNRLGIVGGTNTTIEKHPYQCSVIYYDAFFCSCAIVNKNWVLTLADCIYGVTEEHFEVRVGSASTTNGGKLYSVQSLLYHTKYNVTTRDYDLGLLKLNESLSFSPTVKKIKLATNNLAKGDKATISGWGSNKVVDGVYTELAVTGVNSDSCQGAYSPYNYEVTDSMVCATAAGAGPCYNDFGDPLVKNSKLFGLFSWCFNCGDDAYPGVYTSISAGSSWIKNTIKN